MKILLYMPILAVLAALGSCQREESGVETPQEPQPIALAPKAAEVITSSNTFGIELFASVAQAQEGNLMLSPLSASAALTMLLNGAGGETYAQIAAMLGYPEGMSMADVNGIYRGLVEQLLGADPTVTLSLANAIFYRSGFNPHQPFLHAMAHDFDARVAGLDFAAPWAVDTINQWASRSTHGMIPAVVDQISAETMMLIMNALYFKGQWAYQFDPEQTADRPFYTAPDRPIMVSTMTGHAKVRLHHGEDHLAVELPYGRKNFSMVLVLPSVPLGEFYPQFTPSLWGQITASLDSQSGWTESPVTLPRFRFDFEATLNQQLQAMGMVDAFSPSVANLQGIADQNLYVSMVRQNTAVEVNEQGAEAAAVTVITIDVTSVGPRGVHIDRPFIFAIRERTTNTLLFIGSVVNPSV